MTSVGVFCAFGVILTDCGGINVPGIGVAVDRFMIGIIVHRRLKPCFIEMTVCQIIVLDRILKIFGNKIDLIRLVQYILGET